MQVQQVVAVGQEGVDEEDVEGQEREEARALRGG